MQIDAFHGPECALDLGQFFVIENRGLGRHVLFLDARADDVNAVDGRFLGDLFLVDLERECLVGDISNDVLVDLVFADDFSDAFA